MAVDPNFKRPMAFNLPFRDPDKLEEHFVKFIDFCAKQYQMDSEFYASYTTLVQGSSTGKTKLLHKIAENVKAVYCCFREESSSGYPAKSYIANKLLDKSKDANSIIICGIYLAYLVACVERLQQFEEIFAIFTDTISRISNFASKSEFDPSLRISKAGEKLFPLFYILDTIDIYAKDPQTSREAKDPACLF
ncbi:8218_t:CDS:2 [Funneliformis caledonium]|uniref:8218_t:CDS:1 n=1 Tax=Funneliformis caledonium TaxID=1117310 RepID=A0A9N8VCS3_9GLOM|nr:8218_t:CDS:2 [Funneliformis caledonium]